MMVLKKIADLIIMSFLSENLITQDDLSHIKYNKLTKMYELAQIHLTLLKDTTSQNRFFDATNIVDKYMSFFENT